MERYTCTTLSALQEGDRFCIRGDKKKLVLEVVEIRKDKVWCIPVGYNRFMVYRAEKSVVFLRKGGIG